MIYALFIYKISNLLSPHCIQTWLQHLALLPDLGGLQGVPQPQGGGQKQVKIFRELPRQLQIVLPKKLRHLKLKWDFYKPRTHFNGNFYNCS